MNGYVWTILDEMEMRKFNRLTGFWSFGVNLYWGINLLISDRIVVAEGNVAFFVKEINV